MVGNSYASSDDCYNGHYNGLKICGPNYSTESDRNTIKCGPANFIIYETVQEDDYNKFDPTKAVLTVTMYGWASRSSSEKIAAECTMRWFPC